MQIDNPEIAIYELYIGKEKIAFLYDPRFSDMYWCSYRVDPISDQANEVLRDECIWENVKFTIKAMDGTFPNQNTFGGSSKDFCDRKTNRMSFRSLGPPESRIVKAKRKSLLKTIIDFFGKKTLGENEKEKDA